MSNRQARREQMRANRQQRAAQKPAPRQSRTGSGGGGGGSPRKSGGGPIASILSHPFALLAVGLAVVLAVALGVFYWSNSSSGGEFATELEAAQANFPTELASANFVGEEDAPITLTSYEDFQCPFCLRYTAEDEPQIIEEFVKTGEVRLEFKHLPILGTSESLRAARGAVCMAEQDKFWEFQNRLFLTQAEADQWNDEQIDVGRFSDENLRQYAMDLGADGAAYDACYSSQATLETVQADMDEATSFGLQGTPGFAINGRPVSGGAPADMDGWRALFDQVLAEASASPAASASPTEEESATATPTP